MGREEQKEEREVLDSIFPDEITDISDTEYRVVIVLDAAVEDDEGEQIDPPTIILHVSYPEDYPDVAPNLDISSPPNSAKHPFFDLSEDKPALISSLDTPIEENMGMAMIFSLYSALKEAAEALITERQTAVRTQQESEAAAREEEENRKFHGELVTRERFLAWREKFVAEVKAEEEKKRVEEKEADDKKRRGAGKEEVKLTGRQLWERGLVGKIDEEDDEDGGTDALAIVEKLKIEA